MVVIETALANILPRLEASPDLLGILVLRLICPYASDSMKAEWDDKQDRVQAKTLMKRSIPTAHPDAGTMIAYK